MKIEFFKQLDNVDCGPTCLRIICNYYDCPVSIEKLRKLCYLTNSGASLSSIKDAAEEIGFEAHAVEITINKLKVIDAFPCILYWNKSHYVVLYEVKKLQNNVSKFFIADPAHGKVVLSESEFLTFWENNDNSNKGFALFLEPDFDVLNKVEIDKNDSLNSFNFIFKYFKKFNKNFLQIFFAMLVSSLIALIFPFLTQSIVDIGIVKKDFNFISVILIFQLGLFLSVTIVEIIRSHLMLHISSRINLSIVRDYLKQLLSLPISFFESKLISDLVQRVNDNKRIEDFISSSVIGTFFSSINLIIFSIILFYYNSTVFFVFLFFSKVSIIWTIFFNEKRRNIDYKRFNEFSSSGEYIYELLGNINDVKANLYSSHMSKEFQKKQLNIFKVSIENLKLEQYSQIGNDFFDQLKLIIITYLCAVGVVNSKISLGEMLSISYILGQVNSPVKQIISFIRNLQLVNLSLERINEVFKEKTEADFGNIILPDNYTGDLHIDNLSFRYGNKSTPLVLKNISLIIPQNKVTAVVGTSGSGKSTLIKILLKFIEQVDGNIYLNSNKFNEIAIESWRSKCGLVLQDGHIYNDSFKRNIVLSDVVENRASLENAIRISNLKDIIEGLPMGLETPLGVRGVKLSNGQNQRILLARAIYKNPSFLFLDEATNSLDAKNEREIVENLELFFKFKTVVIVAHRLSTVKNADQIVVLEKGEIVEIGPHKLLIEKKGSYYNLIKNQLELDG